MRANRALGIRSLRAACLLVLGGALAAAGATGRLHQAPREEILSRPLEPGQAVIWSAGGSSNDRRALAPESATVEGPQPVTDYDGNIYRTVQIGRQIWMAEDLKVTHYRDGSPIPNVPDNDVWPELRTGALCWLDDDPSSFKDVYGALYNYFAVADPRKLSPAGWHIPTIDEWLILENELGGRDVAGNKLKDIASHLWQVIHPGANNASGFSARPAGGRGRFGSPGEAGRFATWWASTSYDVDFAWHWGLFPDRGAIRSNPGHKASGFSVRCVKDQ